MFPTVEHFACSYFVTDPCVKIHCDIKKHFWDVLHSKLWKMDLKFWFCKSSAEYGRKVGQAGTKFLDLFRITNGKTVSRFHYLKHSLWQYLIQNTACPVTQVHVKRFESIRGITKLSFTEKIDIYMIADLVGSGWWGGLYCNPPAASSLSVQVTMSAGTGRVPCLHQGLWVIEALRGFLWES